MLTLMSTHQTSKSQIKRSDFGILTSINRDEEKKERREDISLVRRERRSDGSNWASGD